MADCDREYICRNLTCRLGNAVSLGSSRSMITPEIKSECEKCLH